MQRPAVVSLTDAVGESLMKYSGPHEEKSPQQRAAIMTFLRLCTWKLGNDPICTGFSHARKFTAILNNELSPESSIFDMVYKIFEF